MFSSRLHWDQQPNALSAALDAKRRDGAILLDLTESNPTRARLPYPGAEILAAFGDARSLVYEPAPAGLTAAREQVAAYYARKGFHVTPDRILLTASTSEAYAYCFKLLADPGDEVLVPQPSYPLFEFLASMESVRVVRYPLVYQEGWFIDLDELAKAITPRTRAIVIVNPNNPTGSFVKAGELDRLVSISRDRGLALISDEVFSDYTFGPCASRVASLVDVADALTFCLSGLSKIAGLPQMKLGWIVAGGAQSRAAMDRLEWIADTYLSVSTPVQHAAKGLFDAGRAVQEAIAARVRENLSSVQTSCRVLDVEGGWYATLQIPRTRSEEEWVLDLLQNHDVIVQPGYFFDFASEAYLVLSLLTPPDVFREGVRRICRTLQ